MTKYEKNTYNNTTEENSLQNPFFSIITPVFNSEKYLNEYFSSLTAQSFTNFEIIIIDDGSLDSSLSIIKNYQKKLPNIKLIQQPNSGQGVARNQALNIAKGIYCLFIDSDDSLAEKHSLEKLHNHLTSFPSDVTIFAYQKVYGNKVFKPANKQLQLLKSSSVTTLEQKEALLKYKRIGGPWNKVYSREFLQQNSIKFAKNLKFEDAYFFWQVIICANQINFFNHTIYSYRKHNLATMRVNNNKNLDIIKIYELIMNFLKEKHLLETFDSTLLSRALPSFVSQFKKTPMQYKKEFFTRLKSFTVKYLIRENIGINGKLGNKELKIIKALKTNSFLFFYIKSFLL